MPIRNAVTISCIAVSSRRGSKGLQASASNRRHHPRQETSAAGNKRRAGDKQNIEQPTRQRKRLAVLSDDQSNVMTSPPKTQRGRGLPADLDATTRAAATRSNAQHTPQPSCHQRDWLLILCQHSSKRCFLAFALTEQTTPPEPSGLAKLISPVATLQVLPFMWQTDNEEPADEGALAREYAEMLAILAEAKDATRFNKGESAWNGQVHYPLLKLALSSFPAASSRTSLLSDDYASAEPAPASVHKMIDFALLLLPDAPLQSTINNALAKQKCNTINQTAYETLRKRPAPVFVETKVSTGNLASSNVQLAVWTAAWHERLRAIRADQRVIAIPVLQVYGNVWQVLFAIDNEDELLLLDQSMRIGDTSTITGLYQLRAALAVIAKWIDGDFKAWITKFLTDDAAPGNT
ncbi:hypothetical protein QQZ08_000416 [Neonectria magnoliae]|uniref:PD-(D/E)XK nuclease-like domain-containing protein n=1 Tax=Neonectria magnoliae TaxID=2732573 RepID=A0ABR1IH31_9HYPO